MNSQIAIHTEHGPLYGQLLLPPDARGLVVLAHAGTALESGTIIRDASETNTELPSPNHDEALAVFLHRAGLASLTINLVTQQENRFPDARNNVPLHAKRLLDCLAFAKRQLLNDELTAFPIGLCGSDTTSPVVVRIAALRDNDISAVVCRGGLIDLAGTLYLHSLAAPLLMLVGGYDEHLIVSSRRALKEVSAHKEMKLIPDSNSDFATSSAFGVMAQETVRWFVQQLPPP